MEEKGDIKLAKSKEDELDEILKLDKKLDEKLEKLKGFEPPKCPQCGSYLVYECRFTYGVWRCWCGYQSQT